MRLFIAVKTKKAAWGWIKAAIFEEIKNY